MFKKFAITLAAAATLFASVTPSQAIGLSFTRGLSTIGGAQVAGLSERTKLSYQLFCLQYGNDCRTSSKSVVAYTGKLRILMSSVNRSVNRVMPQLRASRDFLSLQPVSSNGHDHAMTKRSRLIDAGVPAGALRVATVKSKDGGRYAVLIVTTTTGDYILDHHKTSVIKSRSNTYQFATIQPSSFLD